MSHRTPTILPPAPKISASESPAWWFLKLVISSESEGTQCPFILGGKLPVSSSVTAWRAQRQFRWSIKPLLHFLLSCVILGNNTDGYQLVEWGACKHVRVLVVLFVCSVVFFIFEILNFKVESYNKVVFYLSLKYHYWSLFKEVL